LRRDLRRLMESVALRGESSVLKMESFEPPDESFAPMRRVARSLLAA
jgi:hypothetical protein